MNKGGHWADVAFLLIVGLDSVPGLENAWAAPGKAHAGAVLLACMHGGAACLTVRPWAERSLKAYCLAIPVGFIHRSALG